MAIIAEKQITLKNGKTVTIKSCTSKDIDALITYRTLMGKESTNTYHHPDMTFDLPKEITYVDSIEKHPKSFFVCVFFENRIIANLGITPVKDNHPWASHLAYFGVGILKEFWGSGLIKVLLQEMDTYTRKLGYKKIEATVKSTNEAGLQAYLDVGFVIEGTRKRATIIDGRYSDEYFIAKYLDLDPWLPPTLHTDRLTLRAITVNDAESIFNYAKLPEVTTYTLWEPHQSIQDTKKWIRTYVKAKYASQEFEPWGICLASNPKEVIGTIGCFTRNTSRSLFEMGFALSPTYWGQGYTAEAGKKAIDFMFTNTQAHKIFAVHKSPNTSSGKAMLKMGMTYEATLKEHLYSKGKYWDSKYYSIFKS